MKLTFNHDLSLQLRFFIAVLAAVSAIIFDSQFKAFDQIRVYMDTVISPFYFISNTPREFFDKTSKMLAKRSRLEIENRILHQELLLKNSKLLTFNHYKKENARLRSLLNSPLRKGERVMVTQVISSVNDPCSDQVVIDKGSINGVYEGQVVIDDRGIVGQVVAVAKLTSRVLLICDATHALPIQVLRSDIRVIASGIGCFDELELKYLPPNVDIRVGDLLITSGLGGRFPEGYPVAVVSSIKGDVQRAYTVIRAKPTASLNRLHYLLLLWSANSNEKNPTTPKEVCLIAKERLVKADLQVLPLSLIGSARSSYNSHLPFLLGKEDGR